MSASTSAVPPVSDEMSALVNSIAMQTMSSLSESHPPNRVLEAHKAAPAAVAAPSLAHRWAKKIRSTPSIEEKESIGREHPPAPPHAGFSRSPPPRKSHRSRYSERNHHVYRRRACGSRSRSPPPSRFRSRSPRSPSPLAWMAIPLSHPTPIPPMILLMIRLALVDPNRPSSLFHKCSPLHLHN